MKLFEVDEVVNKIRSEVEADAEVIIGAITDPSLEGKIRVSIVATSLDGQQPETKSVINMVHRIQNRNQVILILDQLIQQLHLHLLIIYQIMLLTGQML